MLHSAHRAMRAVLTVLILLTALPTPLNARPLPSLLQDQVALEAPHVTSVADDALMHSSAGLPPSMIVTPDRLTFMGALDDPRLITATVFVSNSATLPFTWTARFNPPTPPGLMITPTSGTAPGSMAVLFDVGQFAHGGTGTFIITGTFGFTLSVTADPTMTVGSPFTLPVTLRVVDRLKRVYLPIVQESSTWSPPPPPTYSLTTRFGVVFINSVEGPADEARFQTALETGAGVDRWPLYWSDVEKEKGNFTWRLVDRAVISDTAHGLQVDAVLLNTPLFYATAGTMAAPVPRIGPRSPERSYSANALGSSPYASPPAGITNTVFTDGTDVPGITKTINSNNPWARFVYETVERYKPSGVLAQQQGWPADRGVRDWEIWNEEDTDLFWSGTPQQYARLLKVAYLSARHADPQAKIIFGGILHDLQKLNWLKDTLAEINTYPDHDAGNWFFDSVADHNYIYPWGTWYHLWQASEVLKTYTITNKSLWVTESGAWLCGDYPGPPCISPLDGKPVPNRANKEEQAAFVIENAVYATWINSVIPVDTIFHFQLYDDCSDPIYVPELGVTYGGGLGLMRNPSSAPCFKESPFPNTQRPAYAAFQTAVAQMSNVVTQWRKPTSKQELFAFYRPSTQERVLAMWAKGYVTQTAVFTATSASAQLIGPAGISQVVTPTNGVYTVTLPAATMIYTATTDGNALIGGTPYLRVEPDPSGTGGPMP